MTRNTDKYADYVEHPRFGRGPIFIGLNPQQRDEGLNLHWNAVSFGDSFYRPTPERIANTAIVADISRQVNATVPVTHYFDLERTCVDCNRRFIFFAKEQKHWYEKLGFGLEADCIRCVECRKQERELKQMRAKYESLLPIADKSPEQCVEMADICLTLIEAGIFTTMQQTQRVRMLLNSVPDDADVRKRGRFRRLTERIVDVEARSGDRQSKP